MKQLKVAEEVEARAILLEVGAFGMFEGGKKRRKGGEQEKLEVGAAARSVVVVSLLSSRRVKG